MTNIVTLRRPPLRMRESAYLRMRAYIELCPVEIGGIGAVTVTDGILTIDEVFLLPQECSAWSTLLDASGMSRFRIDWELAGRDPSELRFWWHSHAAGPCFWSRMDERTIDRRAQDDFEVSYVGNHRRDEIVRIDARSPFPITINEIGIEIVPEDAVIDRDAIRAEIAEKVRMRSYTPSAAEFTESFVPVDVDGYEPAFDPAGIDDVDELNDPWFKIGGKG